MKIAASSLSLSIVCGLIAVVTACGGKQRESDGSLKMLAPVVDVAEEPEEVVCLAPGIERNDQGLYLCANASCGFVGWEGLEEIAQKQCTIVYGGIHLTALNGPELGYHSSEPDKPALTHLDQLATVKSMRSYLQADGTFHHNASLGIHANLFLASYDGLAQLQEASNISIGFSSKLSPASFSLKSLKTAFKVGIGAEEAAGTNAPKHVLLGLEEFTGLSVDGNSTKEGFETIEFVSRKSVKVNQRINLHDIPGLKSFSILNRLSADSFLEASISNPKFVEVGITGNANYCQPEIEESAWRTKFPHLPTGRVNIANNCTK